METISISKLKAHLSAEIKKVRNGARIVVLDHNHPVAEIIPTETYDLFVREAQVSYEVVSYAGVTLSSDDLVVIGGGTVSRRITEPVGAYLVVRTPPDATIYGSVSYVWPTPQVAGLASVPITSADLASRAPRVSFDPHLGQ